MQIDTKPLLEQARLIALDAGSAIMSIYTVPESFGTQYKEDDSPLTRADLAAHQVINQKLSQLTPAFPVLSEESRSTPYEERRTWDTFWLVDPLDGTKEFLKRNGEFTVNIALIQGGRPILGVVYAPSLSVSYFAAEGLGAWKQERKEPPQQISVSPYEKGPLKVVASRSHAGPETQTFLENLRQKFGEVEVLSMGSAFKFCLVAEGKAHLYPRFGPTMEWDTAAAQCVVAQAGGKVVALDGSPLLYNKEDLRNPHFVVESSPLPWQDALASSH